jgi:hypothetical protein
MTRHTVIFIAVVVLIAAPFVLIDNSRFPFSDGAEHGAAVRALAANMLHPGDPMLSAVSGASPRYVPSIFIMALFMKASGLDVLVVLKIFELAGFVLFLIAVALFSKEYFNDAGQAPWSLAFLLFFWGLGWREANAYMFSAILDTAYYPSVVAFSSALLALYFQLRFISSTHQKFLFAAIAVGALCFTNHPVTGIFFLVCSGCLYLEQKGFNKKTVFCYTLTILMALSLTVLWPYYNFWASFKRIAVGEMQNTLDYDLTRQYLYSTPLLRAGPALIGIPVLIFYFIQRQYLLLWGGYAVFGFIYLAGYYCTISLAERVIFFSMCLLQLATSRLAREWLTAASGPVLLLKKRLSILLIVILAGGGALQSVLVFQEFIYPSFSFVSGSLLPRHANPNAMQNELKQYLGPGDIVLSDIFTSWSVPVYTGAKIVALFHSSPHIGDNAVRIRDVEAFYNPKMTSAERDTLVKKYGVTHILLNFKINEKQFEPVMKKTGYPEIVHTDSFCIFRTSKRLPGD